jgi:hypothetical protein
MAALGAHLNSCATCASLLTELRVVDALLATTSVPDLAPNFTFVVMAELRNTPALARPHSTPLWRVLALYLTIAWIAVSAFVVIAGRAPWLAAFGMSLREGLGNAFSAIAGAAHGIAPAGPLVVAFVSVVLVLDAMLATIIITYYRAVHPRLAEHLASTEPS